MPFLVLLFLLAFIDRTNISVASLGMKKELGFNDTIIGAGAGIFFLGYFLLEIPGYNDYWFAMGSCGEQGSAPGQTCVMPWKRCHLRIWHYIGPGCSGPSVTIDTWQYGC